jgi:hypothetical protein
MSAFATSAVIVEKVNFDEASPTCFQTCNAFGDILRQLNGWNAVETGTFINECTASCEQINKEK